MGFRKSFIVTVILSFCCLTSGKAFAECKDAYEAKGKNGTVYCISKVGMNWWSAFTWCEAQNMKLGDMNDLCYVSAEERWLGSTSEGSCPNIVNAYSGNVFTWTALARSSTTAYVINPRTGSLNSFGKSDSGKYVICAPKK